VHVYIYIHTSYVYKGFDINIVIKGGCKYHSQKTAKSCIENSLPVSLHNEILVNCLKRQVSFNVNSPDLENTGLHKSNNCQFVIHSMMSI